MYETVLVKENVKYYHGEKPEEGERISRAAKHPTKGVIFHDGSTEHVHIVGFFTKLGVSVGVTLRKDEIPSWVNTPEE